MAKIGEFLETVASKRFTIIFVLSLCLCLRLGMAYYKGDAEVAENDARMYMQIAHNLLAGKGVASGAFTFEAHSTAHVDPIYPAFLALVFSTLGDGPLDVYTVQAVVDTLSCFLVFLIASRFMGPRRLPAMLAALGYALYPPFILSACTPMTETLSFLLCLISFWLLMAAFRKSLWWFAIAGALMGITCLNRSAMMLFPMAVFVLLFLRRGEVRAWLPKALVYIGITYMVIAPWTIRNFVVFHSFIPITTRTGMGLWGGTGPADGMTMGNWRYPIDSVEHRRLAYRHPHTPVVSEATYLRITALQEKLNGLSEVECDHILRRAAIEEIKQHPGRFAFLSIKKFFRLWFNLWHDFPASTESICIAILNAIILLLATLGYIKTRADAYFKLVTLGACAYVTVVSMISFAVVRYSYPVMPLVITLAAGYVGKLLANLESVPVRRI